MGLSKDIKAYPVIRIIKSHWLFIMILVLALALRLYRLKFLTTFGRDQGIDFISVYQMMTNHKLTLIGIKVSIGEFFQGPIYLYLLVPFFYLFNFNPIAGAYTAVAISALTLIGIYWVALKWFDKLSAIFSSLLLAVSSEFIKYGNTPFYQHFAPLFMIIGLGFLYKYLNAKKLRYAFLIGLSAGLAMETHWLFVTYGIGQGLYFIYRRKLSALVGYLGGLLLGLLPTIVFEVRHSFLNVNLLINFIGQGGSGAESLVIRFSSWIEGLGMFFGGQNLWLGGGLGLILIYLLFFSKRSKSKQLEILMLFKLILIVLLISTCLMTSLGAHYLLPIWIMMLLTLPYLWQRFKVKGEILLVASLVLFNLLVTVSQLNNNHGYYMPNGWSLNKIEATAQIITEDSKQFTNYNVASILDGDTRTYPLRYSLMIRKVPVGAVEDYPGNDYLYLVANRSQNLQNGVPWEVSSFVPFEVGSEWYLGDEIVLYRLDRRKEV